MTQVTAAALAAVTAAVLGSRLGTAGTLAGAAGASVILNVGTAVYRASLEHSRERVRALARRARLSPTSAQETGTGNDRTADAALDDEQIAQSDDQLTDSADRRQRFRDRYQRFFTLRWGAVLLGTLVAFVLAMLAITGFEQATGETLSGNSEGTTIGQVVRAPSGPQNSVTPSAPSSSDASTSPTSTDTTSVPASSEPDGGSSSRFEQGPSTTSGAPQPSEVRPTPPLIPTEVPGARN